MHLLKPIIKFDNPIIFSEYIKYSRIILRLCYALNQHYLVHLHQHLGDKDTLEIMSP